MSALFLKRRLMLEKIGNSSSLSNQSPPKVLQGNPEDSRIQPRSLPQMTTTSSSNSNDASSNANNNNNKDGSRFPALLFRMLQRESTRENGVVSWTPRGDSFTIRDSEAFATLILPQYFGKTATKYRSFQRQMNLYGFSRNSKASKGGCANYHHAKFVRDRPGLVRVIQRKQEASGASKESKATTNRKTVETLEDETSRRVSLDTAASQEQQQEKIVPQDPIAAVVASYLATTAKETPQRRRLSSKKKQPKKAVDALEDICNVLLPPQQGQKQDVDVRQSLDEAFQVFLQEDDSWDLVQ
jgi:hypothetical protein